MNEENIVENKIYIIFLYPDMSAQILNVNFNGSQINQYLISRRQVNKRTKWVVMTFKNKIKTNHKWIKIILEKWSCGDMDSGMKT